MPPFNPNLSSRKIEDLIPVVGFMATKHLADCKRAGIDLLITCTYRCPADQDKLYAQGRTTKGPVVTNAKAWDSMHQYRIAYDVVPLRDGKPVWGTSGADGELWAKIGAIGEACGLEWAGRWKSFREFPHFQYTAGLKVTQLKNGSLPQSK